MTPASTGTPRALFEIAHAEGTLDEVEDELFRFARSYESSEELRNALTDELVPAARRQAIVEDLLGGKATPTTAQLVSMVVGSAAAATCRRSSTGSCSGRRPTKDVAVAEVRTAVPLTDDQQDRLRAALANATGQATSREGRRRSRRARRRRRHVGDTVIDGTVRTRLDQLKSRL